MYQPDDQGNYYKRGGVLVPHWYDGLSVGNLASGTNDQEISGIATAWKDGNENHLWAVSDSPANELKAISRLDASNQGVWTLQSPPTYVDWEEISSAVIGGVPYLYIFDMGNNGNGTNSRGSGIDLRIFRCIEPTITGSNGQITSGNYIQIDCAFPGVNGPTLRDAEAAFIDPDTGTIYIIIKRDATPQRVYSLAHAESYTGTQTLVYEGAMTALPESRTVPLTTTPCFAVGACINPKGTEILVKNYDNVYYFPRNKATQTIIQALQQSLVAVPAYVGGGSLITNNPKSSHPNQEPQGEAICYSKNGRDLYTASEYIATEGSTPTGFPLFKYSRASKAPTTLVLQEGLNGYTGTTSTYIWETNPGTDRSAEATFVVDKTVGNPTDDRRGLLKFDLTSVPSTAIIIGAKLELWIAAEGQGITMHRMLVPWVGSSTHTSLGGVNNDGVKAEVGASVISGFNLNTILNTNWRLNLLVSDVQFMVANPSLNEGWLLLGLHNDDGMQFDGKNGGTQSRKPKLTLRYI